jgi:hypothetical protein
MSLVRFLAARLPQALALAAALACACAQAQNVVLTPAVVPLAGHPGQGVTQALTLRNDTDQPLELVLEARDVVVRNGARVFVAAGELQDSIAATAVFTPARLRIEPHASGTALAAFTLPPQVRTRAVVAFFRSTRPVRSGAARTMFSLGTLFTFSLSDRVSVQADALVVTPPSASANATLSVHLRNDGDEPVVPAGTAVILDAQGHLAGKAVFQQRRLLPGEALDTRADYAGELAAGSYRVVATFDVAGRPINLSSGLEVR